MDGSEASPPEFILGKSVLKKCSKFTEEHPCRSVIPKCFFAHLGNLGRAASVGHLDYTCDFFEICLLICYMAFIFFTNF